MLLEPTIKEGDIISLKMSNGDELIARLNTESPSHLTLTKPMLMVLTQDNRTGQPGVQMVPFFMLGADKEGKFPLNKTHIVCYVKSNEDAKAGYLEVTTGLAIPKATGAKLIQS